MLRRLAVLLLCSSLIGATPVSYEASKEQLATLYATLKTLLQNTPIHRKQLINTQRSWRAFRDAECEFVTTDDEQNNEHIDSYRQCAEDMTLARIRALQHYLHCAETGTDCTVAPP